jgi:very-short-patch-repair endonuclease
MSKLEEKFEFMWNVLGGQRLIREFRFHNERRWRFDFCDPEKKLAIEIEGGVFSGGRHTRGTGFEKDCEKHNAAALLGYRVFKITTNMIGTKHLEPIIKEFKK